MVQFWALVCCLTAVFISTSKGSNTLPLLCWHWMHVNSQTHSYIEKKKKRDKCWKRGNIWFTLSMKIIFNILELPPYVFKVPSWFPNIALEQSSGQCCFYCENIKLVKMHTNHTNQKFGDMIQHVSVMNSIILDINDLSYL